MVALPMSIARFFIIAIPIGKASLVGG